ERSLSLNCILTMQTTLVYVTWISVKPLHSTIVLFSDRESHEDTHVTEDLLPQAKVPLFQRDHINSKKAQAMRKDQKRQEAKLRIRGNSESPLFGKDKHQPDIGPCRRKMDGIIQRMKDNSRIMALSLYLPNCDKKGFFKLHCKNKQTKAL
uniref:Insulin-like growth factor binding protein 5a n=1 Tax=Cyprinus carpio TaxID=7962 RepID=A0A8C1M1G7_CYPCA